MFKVISAAVFLFLGLSEASADIIVEMLNKKGKERMIYSQKIVSVKVGETVNWKATNKGHNVQFIMKNGVPDGVAKFKSKINKDASYQFQIPGIYAYWCTPHKSMGMIGFVVVGSSIKNIENIKKIKFSGKSKKIAKKLIMDLAQL